MLASCNANPEAACDAMRLPRRRHVLVSISPGLCWIKTGVAEAETAACSPGSRRYRSRQGGGTRAANYAIFNGSVCWHKITWMPHELIDCRIRATSILFDNQAIPIRHITYSSRHGCRVESTTDSCHNRGSI